MIKTILFASDFTAIVRTEQPDSASARATPTASRDCLDQIMPLIRESARTGLILVACRLPLPLLDRRTPQLE